MNFSITKIILSAVSLILLVLSFHYGDAENYLFPRIITVAIAIFAILLWFEKDNAVKINIKPLLPGLLVVIVYVFLLDILGFYVSSFLAFLSIVFIYQEKTSGNFHRMVIHKIAISLLFVAILYLLFGLLLQVRTPSGIVF